MQEHLQEERIRDLKRIRFQEHEGGHLEEAKERFQSLLRLWEP